MKIKFLLWSTCTLGLLFAGSIRAQMMGINLTGATLYDTLGTPLVDGRLIQLVGSVDTTFSTPTTTSFVSGNDVILASFGLDASILSIPGSFQVALNIDTSGSPGLVAGSQLLLRWYDIDFVSGQTAPGTTTFGQFRTDNIVDESDTGWFLPSAGSSISLNFVTAGNGGSQPELAGHASNSTSAVPEPAATAALAALGALVLVCGRLRFTQQRLVQSR